MLTRKAARDLAARAFHTWWQTFLSVVVFTWTASGLDVGSVGDWSSARHFAWGAVLAVGAAAASALKTTLLSLRITKRGSTFDFTFDELNAPGVLTPVQGADIAPTAPAPLTVPAVDPPLSTPPTDTSG